MNPEQAKAFGRYLRDQRMAAKLSVRQLQEATGIHNSLLVRMEQGAIANPTPEKLQRIAAALSLPLADLYARADYLIPEDLPGLSAYLRLKYRELSAARLDVLEAEIRQTLTRHELAPVTVAGHETTDQPGEDAERG